MSAYYAPERTGVGRLFAMGEGGSSFEQPGNDRQPDPADEMMLRLHPREREILGLLAEGLSNRQIGERIFRSPETVKWYLKRLFRKLDVGTREQAVAWAKDNWSDRQSG